MTENHRAKTYTVYPDNSTLGVRKVTCNSVESCAETAVVFFLTPCRIESPIDGDGPYRVGVDGKIGASKA